ncbi:hypothetical protein JOC77_002802 [Peribacillus deserti]|uniref:Uncharacterized protein n=1 Tax=Peribacillus deserti TaxID=673318 RepID=A0ABS2QJL4_9BACI|nr:hypothetical protein [Peribacillus deserti]MBM7693362.1 hypothetical protein [Peribacillus deserti]
MSDLFRFSTSKEMGGMMGIVLSGDELVLKSVRTEDFETLWKLIYSEENPEWKG